MIRMVLMLVLMLLVFTSTAFSQFSLDFTGTGARAQGMGNAFIAVSNDASAASWNPAGLTAHDKLLMGFDMNTYSPENDFTLNSNLYSQMPSFSSMSQFSIITPLRLRGRLMIFGISFGKVFEEFWNDGYDSSDVYFNEALGIEYDPSTITINRIAEEHSDLSVLNIAVGSKFSPKLSLGASINIYSGESVSVANTVTNIPHYTHDIIAGQYVVLDQYLEVIDTALYSGVNFTFGGKYEGGKLDLGFILRTPFDLSTESDTKINSRTVENGLLQAVGSDTIYIDNQVVKIGVPWTFGLGAAVHPNENMTLSADIELRSFSGEKLMVRDSLYIRPGSANEEFFSVHDLDNYNTTSIRAGLEYNWHSPWAAFPVIPLRAGFSTYSNTINKLGVDMDPNDNVGIPFLDQASWTNIHLGFGIKWSQIYLDAAITFSTIELPLTIPGAPDPDNPGSYLPDTQAKWDNSSTSLVFGFTGYF